MTRFGDYAGEGAKWISFVESEFFPDTLEDALPRYSPIVVRFGELISAAKDSKQLYLLIMDEPREVRVQLLRIFRKYVSPDTSVEMLKRKNRALEHVAQFGDRFRPVETVRKNFASRPAPDEALVAVLREYEDRGEKGYELTSRFFRWFAERFDDEFQIEGPPRAGRDIDLKDVFPGYPKSRPVDFVIRDKKGVVLVVGLARYDTDRGGAQEDDRTGGYGNAVTELLGYAEQKGLKIKLLFVNDGPGLLLGSMWRDYAALEDDAKGRLLVVTLKMLNERVTEEWLRN